MKAARILIVDDDVHVREALVDELSASYRVESVASGGEAFDALTARQFDVVISDLKMPDHDGIEVLEFARRHQRDAVRVLLTGYVDDRAQRALMRPDAPFKVGKPWHDEIEIVVRRGLEQREVARRLAISVEDALGLNDLDLELAEGRTPAQIGEVIVRRAQSVDGVTACAMIVRSDGVEQVVSGGVVPRDGAGWFVDLALDCDGDLRLRARGETDTARQLVSFMAHRAQRAAGLVEARVGSFATAVDAGHRTNLLMRQATLGALTSSLLHDMASTMQALSAALADVQTYASEDPALMAEAVSDANAAGTEAVQLFVQMRKFIRDGQVTIKPVRLDRLVDRVVKLTASFVRERAKLQVSELPAVEIDVSEAMFLQVLANLLRNAANASPPGGVVDVRARVTDTEVVVIVTDDGPGVAPETADHMFDPFASMSQEGTGLGLAISAYVMHLLGGRISYRKHPERGACFSVTLPRRVPPIVE